MDYTELLKLALDAGVVTKNGNHHLFGEVKLGNGAALAIAFLKDSPDVVAAIKAALDQGKPPSPGKPPVDEGDGEKAAGARKSFKVLSALRHDGHEYGAGDGVKLTRKQHDALKNTGAIEGDW